MITRVVTSLTKETTDLAGSVAVSLIKLQTNGTSLNFRETIKSTLNTISVKTVGRNFLAIVGIEVVEVLMEYAKLAGLTDIKNQWLYVISDANRYKMDVGHLKKLLKEGDNVAFIYNTTSENGDCVVMYIVEKKINYLNEKKNNINIRMLFEVRLGWMGRG